MPGPIALATIVDIPREQKNKNKKRYAIGGAALMLLIFASVALARLEPAAIIPGLTLAAMYLLYMVGRVVWGPLVEPEGHHDGHSGLPIDLNMREIATLVLADRPQMHGSRDARTSLLRR